MKMGEHTFLVAAKEVASLITARRGLWETPNMPGQNGSNGSHSLGKTAQMSYAVAGQTHAEGLILSSPEITHPTVEMETAATAIINELMDALPDSKRLTSEERRGIIARYASVLEGNFIYWMTATAIATKAEESAPILLDNLNDEVRDCHPLMMRKFALAANAFPTDKDALAVDNELTNVRQFLGKLSPVKSVLMMAFFEGFIQRFMAYLACLAADQGSTESEYTDVHGVCDIEHTEGLYKVLAAEIALAPSDSDEDLFEGVTLLRALIEQIIRPS
jgi:hypothetical protein